MFISISTYRTDRRHTMQLIDFWLLSALLLVKSQISSTNEIDPSSVVISPSSDYDTSAISLDRTDLTSNLNTTLVNISSTSLAIDIFTPVTISATSVMQSHNPTATVQDLQSSSPVVGKTTISSIPTPTPVVIGNDNNVTCSGVGNTTDCKEYRGQNNKSLTTPMIIGIACGSAALVLLIVVATAICCARKKQRLSGSKADLSSYWEDNVTLSYINGHVDLPRDYPDEMISLDNDSFLNSLDSMSFTNIWTAENAKHTNF